MAHHNSDINSNDINSLVSWSDPTNKVFDIQDANLSYVGVCSWQLPFDVHIIMAYIHVHIVKN